MQIGPRAEAPAAGLDAEQIVEQSGHEVAVQQPAAVAQAEGDDRQASGAVGLPRISMRGSLLHEAIAR